MSVKPKDMLAALVRGYRYFIGPLLPPACRFYPSCSAYAEQALQQHGALSGGWLAARRVCRCGPWCAGGFDPVPEVQRCVNSPAHAPLQGQQ
jgi:putative membrane protein insertion efficiency factor